LGSDVHRVAADEHDRTVAWISHLPHLVASLVAAVTPADCLPWAATGWRDTTRIAAGDVPLWSQIIATNRAHLLHALESFGGRLHELQRALLENDPQVWELVLTQGKDHRDAVAD
jgi:prephenate dehydrogenase